MTRQLSPVLNALGLLWIAAVEALRERSTKEPPCA